MGLKKAWAYLWNVDDNEKKIGQLSLNEEQAIKDMINNILSKEGVIVSMAPKSNKYYIIHKEIQVNILINGAAELVKISNHDWKYAWKFRNSFINELIDLVVKKIEEDRFQLESEIFENEISLINKINTMIGSLKENEKKFE